MYRLTIIDTSALVHTAQYSSFFKDKSQYAFPVGGIQYLMRYVTSSLRGNDDVILVFDSKHNKRKEIMQDYKSNRVANKSVLMQLDTLYEELPYCGIRCYKEDGYEGDDLINWAVCQNIGNYNEIQIIGNDIDLTHNVQNGVFFKSIVDGVNDIYTSNFTTSLVKGEKIVFNTISIYKIFNGCHSDNVAPFVSENGYKGPMLYKTYLQILEMAGCGFTYALTANKDLFFTIIAQMPCLTEKDREILKQRANIIFPLENEKEISLVGSNMKDVVHTSFNNFLSMYGDFNSCRVMGYTMLQKTEEMQQHLKEKAYKLKSGEYAVDNNLRVNEAPTASTLLLKEF